MDWDENGIVGGTALFRNVNQVTSTSGGTNSEALAPFDDWSYLATNLCDSYAHPNWSDVSDATSCNNFGAPGDLVDISFPEAQELLDREFFVDCDGDGVDDEAALAAGTAFDSDGDGLLDACELLLGDVDLDQDVDATDRSLLMASFGLADGEPGFEDLADLDRDRFVTFVDVQLWQEAYDRFQTGNASPATRTPSCGLTGIEIGLLAPFLIARRRRLR